MNYHEYVKCDGIELARLIREKEVSASEVLETAILRAEEVNPKINALSYKLYDYARDNIDKLGDGPFKGVPFILKDLLADLEGVPTSSGSKTLKDIPAKADAELVKRFKAAGLNIFGKSTCPELGITGHTETEAFGATRNPWNTDYSSGGSSGGASALVAAGVIPIAGAGDGGGSIRIPSSYCGLLGLKPTRGRVPSGPFYQDPWDGAVQEFVLTRSVRDAATMLDFIHGADPTSSYQIRDPEQSYVQAIDSKPLKGLRIGYVTKPFIGDELIPTHLDAVQRTAKSLENMGHHVEIVNLDFDQEEYSRLLVMMYMGQVSADLRNMTDLTGKKHGQLELELGTRVLAALGRSMSGYDYVCARRNWQKYSIMLADYFTRFDLLLTPTVAAKPPRVGELDLKGLEKIMLSTIIKTGLTKVLFKSGLVFDITRKQLGRVPFAALANYTGTPAISIPLGMDPEGLPIGSHFIAPVGREDRLLKIAKAFEEAEPWFNRMPKI